MSDVTEPADPFEIALAPPARRAITSKLPPDVAVAAVDFITGPLIGNPKRLGKPLHAPLDGVWSARFMRDWRVLYEIDDGKHEVLVVDIRHRADAYRRR
jgi:mRNA-degrading endonuclease RelE of RelBE toxin-antitoxin system